MHQHIGWVRVDPKRAGALQVLHSVASRLQRDPERAFADGRKHVPNAVADNNAVTNGAQAFCRRYKDVGGRLGFFHVIASHNLDAARQVQVLEQKARLGLPARGCDCNTNTVPGEMVQQLIRARQRG